VSPQGIISWSVVRGVESYRGFRNARLADGMGYYHPLRRTRTSVNPTIARNKMTAMTAGASAFRALPLTGSSAKSRLCILLFRNPNDFLVFIFFSFPIRTGSAPEFAYSLTQAEWHVLTFVSRQWAGCLLKRRLKMMSFPRKRSMNLIAALELNTFQNLPFSAPSSPWIPEIFGLPACAKEASTGR